MNGSLDGLTSLFGGGSAGESALAPGAGVTSFLGSGVDNSGGIGGLGTYEKMIGQWDKPPMTSSGLGGYERGMGAMIDPNQAALRSQIYGDGGGMGNLAGLAGLGKQAAPAEVPMMSAPSVQMPGMPQIPAPPNAAPQRGMSGQAPAFPGLQGIKLMMAANALKQKLGIK